MNRHVVFGEVVIDEMAEALVDHEILGQRRPDAEDHAADRLRPRRLGIEDAPGREHAEHAAQADLAGILVDADLGEMRAIGLLAERLARVARIGRALGRSVGPAKGRDLGEVERSCRRCVSRPPAKVAPAPADAGLRSSLPRRFAQASKTAEPAELAPNEPPDPGAAGKPVSPSSTLTLSIGRPSMSAAIWPRIV